MAADLSVCEEKHNWNVLEASFKETVLHILSPLSDSIVFGQLYLKAVVVSPVCVKFTYMYIRIHVHV